MYKVSLFPLELVCNQTEYLCLVGYMYGHWRPQAYNSAAYFNTTCTCTMIQCTSFIKIWTNDEKKENNCTI